MGSAGDLSFLVHYGTSIHPPKSTYRSATNQRRKRWFLATMKRDTVLQFNNYLEAGVERESRFFLELSRPLNDT